MNFKYNNIDKLKKSFYNNNINFQRKFGQNFLVDEDVIDFIIEKMNPLKNKHILEIGSGIGNITRKLLNIAHFLTCFEIDNKFIEILESQYNIYNNFHLIKGDFLKKFDPFLKMLIEENRNNNIVIFGSLPYYITTPIINKILLSEIKFDNLFFIIQKDVENRIFSKPPDKNWSTFTIFINTFTSPEIVKIIKSDSFYPKPKVDSIFINFKRKDKYNILDKNTYFTFVKTIFDNRRKTIINNLIKEEYFNILGKQTLLNILKKLEISSNTRGESLSINKIVNISNEIYISKKY